MEGDSTRPGTTLLGPPSRDHSQAGAVPRERRETPGSSRAEQALRRAVPAWQTYLVEHYPPGIDVDALRRAAASLRTEASAMAGEGSGLRYLRSTIVPADEAFLTVFEADSADLVRKVYERTGIPFQRVSLAVSADNEERST